jgi:hypothetical protein
VSMALQQQLNARDKPAIYPTEFRTEYEADPADPAKLTPKDWVTWTIKGSASGNLAPSCSDKVDRLRKDAVMWAALEPHYEAWKKNQEAPVDGTPLDAWPGVTPQQVKIMHGYHLRTVEDFATAPGGTIIKMGIPGALQLQARAQRFLEAAGFMSESGGTAQIAAQLSVRDDKISMLEHELAEMRRAMAEFSERRGPGRPRKVVQETEDEAA